MNVDLHDLSLDLSNWTHYKTVEPFSVLDVPINGLKQSCYETQVDGEIISAGVFEYQGKKTHIAWGIKSEPHCSFHALALPGGSWSAPIMGCPEYKILRYQNTISGFSIDGSVFSSNRIS